MMIMTASHFDDEDKHDDDDDDGSTPGSGELREAGTIGQIQLAMLAPVGSYSAKDKTEDPRVCWHNQNCGQVHFVQKEFNTFAYNFKTGIPRDHRLKI